MRRRGKSSPFSSGYGCEPHSSPGSQQAVHHDPRVVRISPVPQEWIDNAHQAWRILFPDLEWTAPERDLE
jgi:hypothetical protein